MATLCKSQHFLSGAPFQKGVQSPITLPLGVYPHCKWKCDCSLGRQTYVSFTLASAGNNGSEDVVAQASNLSTYL